jgi:hypothetical protein
MYVISKRLLHIVVESQPRKNAPYPASETFTIIVPKFRQTRPKFAGLYNRVHNRVQPSASLGGFKAEGSIGHPHLST